MGGIEPPRPKRRVYSAPRIHTGLHRRSADGRPRTDTAQALNLRPLPNWATSASRRDGASCRCRTCPDHVLSVAPLPSWANDAVGGPTRIRTENMRGLSSPRLPDCATGPCLWRKERESNPQARRRLFSRQWGLPMPNPSGKPEADARTSECVEVASAQPSACINNSGARAPS